uniref:Uncharacterized protein n=1 Tax=Setaria italica TaxID=4555 RepID=K3XU06_SETIT
MPYAKKKLKKLYRGTKIITCRDRKMVLVSKFCTSRVITGSTLGTS